MNQKNMKLKLARVARDWSQERLAEEVGASRQTINLIELGKFNPTISLCLKICHALERTLDELFWQDAEDETNPGISAEHRDLS